MLYESLVSSYAACSASRKLLGVGIQVPRGERACRRQQLGTPCAMHRRTLHLLSQAAASLGKRGPALAQESGGTRQVRAAAAGSNGPSATQPNGSSNGISYTSSSSSSDTGAYRFDRRVIEEQQRQQQLWASVQPVVNKLMEERVKPLAGQLRLRELKRQPRNLQELGITSEQVEDVVSRTGEGPASLQPLFNLIMSAQIARLPRSSPVQAAGAAAAAQPPPTPVLQQQQQQQWRPPQQGQALSQQQQPSSGGQQRSQPPPGAPNQQQQQQQQQQGTGWPTQTSLSMGSKAQPWSAGPAAASLSAQQSQQHRVAEASSDDDSSSATAGPRASIRDLLNEERIWLPGYAAGTYNHQLCPACQGGSSGEKSLSVTIEDGGQSAVWICHRAKCGWTGGASLAKRGAAGPRKQQQQQQQQAYTNDSGFAVTTMRKRKDEAPVKPRPKLEPLSDEMKAWFSARGISEATLLDQGVAQETITGKDGRSEAVLAFPYYRGLSAQGGRDLVNVKYRTLSKTFWQVKGAEKILYGLDDIAGQSEVVIVEGEVDKLSLQEAGLRNVVSVPDGAPARVKEGDVPPASDDTKFSYLWGCRAWLDPAVRVVIATDNDAPGDALAEELARRLGRERCWRVRWPLAKADHEYVASLAGLELLAAKPGAQAEQQGSAAAAAAAEEHGQAEHSNSTGSSSSSSSDGAGEVDVGSGADLALPADAEVQDEPRSSEAVLGPRIEPPWYRKDANEVLVQDGPELLKAFIENAEPFPIRGLLRFHEYYDDIMRSYRLELKESQGVSTGWPSLDQYYRVVPGELTIVTGVPNSGKSEWIDALLANLTELHGWTFALCSMEKKAADHARQLVEKYVGRPFFDLPYGRGVRRMSERELDAGLDWVDDRFHLIRYEDDQLPNIDWVLGVARAAVYRYGIRGLVIDPYNELDHQRPGAMSETEYVSQMLTKVKRFAQTSGVHVWFVAHPRQLREWKGQPPNLYDISGSAHFINKADNGIVVHRNRDPEADNQHQVQVLVRKVRNKAAGTIGDCILNYERVNGRYLDPDYPSAPGIPRTASRMEWSRQDFSAAGVQQQQQLFQQGLARAATSWGADGTVSGDPRTPEGEAQAWQLWGFVRT